VGRFGRGAMSWVLIFWSASAGACVLLALLYLLIWLQDRRSWANLCFSVTVLGVLGIVVCETITMHTDSPDVFARVLRVSMLVYGTSVFGCLGFVHFYFFRSGKWWLLVVAGALRAAAMVLTFTTGPNLYMRHVYSLKKIQFLHSPISVLNEWEPNPWVVVAQLASAAHVVYIVDAAVRLWRSGRPEGRRRAGVVGTALAFFIFAGSAMGGLAAAGVIRGPFFVSLPFIGMACVMGFELSRDSVRAAHLAGELRESDESVALAAEAANLGIWVWHMERNEFQASQRAQEMLHIPPAKPLQFDSLLQALQPADRAAVVNAFLRATRERNEFHQECRSGVGNGSARWVALRGRVEFDTHGHPVLVRGITLDITSRKQDEERFQRAVEASPNGILLVDAAGRIIHVNTQVERLLGFSRHELIGNAISTVVPVAAEPSQECWVGGYSRAPAARVMETGREVYARRKDGTEVPIEIGFSAIGDGDHVIVLTTVVDISERRRMELEAARQRNELAHLSRVSMLGELSASLAHELNQPLTAILSNAQAALRFMTGPGYEADELREILEDIVSEDRRAGEVIQRLRLLLTKGQVQHQSLSLNDIVEEVLKLMYADFIGHNVVVETDLFPGLPFVAGDRVQLQQVLLNLVINGCDAMGGTGGRSRKLLLSTEYCEDGSVLIDVSDSGCGVPAGKLEEVFDAFYSTKPQGMGLGLAVCRTIVTAHGGRLWASNNIDGGATFHISLPVVGERVS
jgi:two-component system, LuxR family, sensor kinase FixL